MLALILCMSAVNTLKIINPIKKLPIISIVNLKPSSKKGITK